MAKELIGSSELNINKSNNKLFFIINNISIYIYLFIYL